MILNFNLSEFNISGEDIPEDVADKLLHKHILPMQGIRNVMRIRIWASKKSGYRSKKWELAHGRSGESQHTFQGNGAVDWTCEDFQNNKEQLKKCLILYSKYTRIAEYAGFFHSDYKPTKSGKRELYISDAQSNWKFLKYI